MPEVITVPFNKQVIGQGFNSETRENLGTALSVANISEDPFADGQVVTTAFTIVTDQDSLMESLGMSASVDARYALFSADAKASFAEHHAVNSYSSFIAGRCLVQNAQRRGQGFQLTPTASALVTADNMADFKTAFGDMFVRALNTGGEFLVVARITSISEDHQRTLTASLHAAYNGLTAGGSFSGEFNTAMTQTSNHTEVTVWTQQSGGIGAEATFTGPDAQVILQRLDTFPQSVHDHPIGYEAEIARYNTIPIPVPSAEEREDREIVLADCAQQKFGFQKALSDLNLALDPTTSMLFDGLPSNDTLTQMQGQYRSALNALMSHAIQVVTGHMDPPQMFVANPAPPAISFKKKLFVPPTLQVQIPDVSRMTVVSATQTLAQLGLNVTTKPQLVSAFWVQTHTKMHLTGLSTTQEIFGTDPQAGTMVNPKTLVTILVPTQQ